MTHVQFRDHERFHRAAFLMLASGALAAAALATVVTHPTTPLAAGVVVAAVLAGAALGGVRYRSSDSARAVAAAVAAGGLATYVLGAIGSAAALGTLPPWASMAVAGAAAGLVASLGLLPRHVSLRPDRVGRAYGPLRGLLAGEVRDLCQRGDALWRRVERELSDDDATRATLEQAVLRLVEVARRWHAIESSQAPGDAAVLAARMGELEQRRARTDDPVAARQYASALAALAEQLRYLEHIERRRERVVSLMHGYLAVMEQLRLAAVNAAASRVQPLLDDLAELGREVDRCAAVTELELELATPAGAG